MSRGDFCIFSSSRTTCCLLTSTAWLNLSMSEMKQAVDFVRHNFKGFVLLSILGLLTYLRVSTEDKYFDSVSDFCVASDHQCDWKQANHAYVIENEGTPQEVSLCLENGRKCVPNNFVWSYNSPASSSVLMDSSLPNYRDNIFPHSTLILCVAAFSFVLGALFDHGSFCCDVVEDERQAFSSKTNAYAMRKIVVCLDIIVFAFIIVSATQFYYYFNERCDVNDAKDLCDYLASSEMRIVSIIDSNNILFENYRICFIVLDVMLLFGTLLNVRHAFPPSGSEPVAATGDVETASATDPAAVPYLVDPHVAAQAMLVHNLSVQTKRYINVAARSSEVVDLGPEQACSICLARLLVPSDIANITMSSSNETSGQGRSGEVILTGPTSDDHVELSLMAQTGCNRPNPEPSATNTSINRPSGLTGNTLATPPRRRVELPPLSPATRGYKVVQLPCKHCFHYACIKKWVDSGVANINCPECRHPIVDSTGLST